MCVLCFESIGAEVTIATARRGQGLAWGVLPREIRVYSMNSGVLSGLAIRRLCPLSRGQGVGKVINVLTCSLEMDSWYVETVYKNIHSMLFVIDYSIGVSEKKELANSGMPLPNCLGWQLFSGLIIRARCCACRGGQEAGLVKGQNVIDS